MNYSISSFPYLSLEERIELVCNHGTYVAVRKYYNRFINLYLYENHFFEVFMALERDGIEKVEMLDDDKKLDSYIGYMNRLDDL